jgi:hypothetical protein
MSRQKKQTLGDSKEKKVTEEFLKENPEGIPDQISQEKVVISDHIPKYEEVVFTNQRDPGVMLEFHYRSKTHPIKHYKLCDGEQYNLPKEIIDHLQSCSIPIYGRPEPDKSVMDLPVIGRKYMYSFRNPKSFRKVA